MTMNKKEQARMKELEEAARISRALNWSAPVSRDLPPPRDGASSGWDYNVHTLSVEQYWSTFSFHGRGPTKTNYGGSQNGRSLYSTKSRALQGLRCALELKCATDLAKVDLMIEEAA